MPSTGNITSPPAFEPVTVGSLLITSVLLPLFLFRLGVTFRLLAWLLHTLRGIGGG
jgi:hypothetical protein